MKKQTKSSTSTVNIIIINFDQPQSWVKPERGGAKVPNRYKACLDHSESF